jgi:hypothetical protein
VVVCQFLEKKGLETRDEGRWAARSSCHWPSDDQDRSKNEDPMVTRGIAAWPENG